MRLDVLLDEPANYPEQTVAEAITKTLFQLEQTATIAVLTVDGETLPEYYWTWNATDGFTEYQYDDGEYAKEAVYTEQAFIARLEVLLQENPTTGCGVFRVGNESALGIPGISTL